MLNKLKLFVLIIVMITVPAAVALSAQWESPVTYDETQDMEKAAKAIKKIADDVGPDEKAFESAARELSTVVRRATKDDKVDRKELDLIEDVIKKLETETMELRRKCSKVTKRAERLKDIVEKAISK